MSKIGKNPIIIPLEVTVKLIDRVLEFSSKDGKKTLKIDVLPYIDAKIEDNKLIFNAKSENLQARANWGTMRSLAQNAVTGVKEGFQKILDLQGIGFKANVEGENLVLNIGFSHPVKFSIPAGINISVDKNNSITILGFDKQLVGETAAKIRTLKKPNPYMGTGIRYRNEIVRKKEGKKAAGAVAGAA